jgi:hypothetical protein
VSKKELWEACGCLVYLPNNKGGFSLSECPDSEEYARRIVACVNALAGQPVELIERSTITIPNVTYLDLVERCDQLLEALKKHGAHGANCLGGVSNGKRPCTCGLTVAITAVIGEKS